MNYIRILLIVVLIVQTKCFDSDDEIIEKELELLKKGEEDVSIRGYCDHEYKQPMKGASEWQKPTVPLLLVPGIYIYFSKHFDFQFLMVIKLKESVEQCYMGMSQLPKSYGFHIDI